MRLAFAFLLLAAPAFAAPDDVRQPLQPVLVGGHCPAGLAKKNPPCVPPGLARQGGYRIGDRYDGDDRFIRGDRFGLPPLRNGEAYVRIGDNILKLDREERIILDIIALALN